MKQKHDCNKIPALNSFLKKMPSFLHINSHTCGNSHKLIVLFVVRFILFVIKIIYALMWKEVSLDLFSNDTFLSFPIYPWIWMSVLSFCVASLCLHQLGINCETSYSPCWAWRTGGFLHEQAAIVWDGGRTSTGGSSPHLSKTGLADCLCSHVVNHWIFLSLLFNATASHLLLPGFLQP